MNRRVIFRFTLWLATGMALTLNAANPPVPPSRGDQALADYFRVETAKLSKRCLADIQTLDDWNARRAQYRQQLFDNFLIFVGAELRPRFPDPLYVDGSFITDKVTPDDTDVVLDLTHAPDARKWQGLQFMNDHQARIKILYGVHFWVNLPGQNDFSAFFQYIGVKTARAKGLDPRQTKGILRIA